jgi:hypothetical protein
MNWKFWKKPDILQKNPVRDNQLRKGRDLGFPNRFPQIHNKYYQADLELRKQIDEQKQQQAEEMRRAISSISAYYNIWGVYREGFDKLDNDRLAKNPTYSLCEKAVQDYFATVEWNITDKEKDTVEDAVDFLEAPNGQDTLNTLLKQSVRDVIRYDAGTWVNSITIGGELVEIKAYHGPEFWVELDHDLTTVKSDQGIAYQGNWSHGFVKKYWQHSRLGMFIPFDPEEVTYFMMYPRSESPYGTDFLQNLKFYLEYLLDSTKAAGMVFENGIMPGTAWYHPDITSGQELAERITELNLELQGAEGFGGPIHLIGNEKIEQIVPTLVDLQWLKGQQFASEIVWSMYGFSTSEFSSGGGTRATEYIKRNITKSRMLFPLLKMYETKITRNILPYLPGYQKGWKFEFIEAVDLDDDLKRAQVISQRASTFVTFRQGGLSPKMAAKLSEIGDDLSTTEVEDLEEDFDQSDGQDWMSQLYGQEDTPAEPDGIGMGGQSEDYQGTDTAEAVQQLGRPEPMQKAIRKGKVRQSSGQNQRLDVYVHLVTS